MPVLLKGGQSTSQEEAVEEIKDCRSITQHWCRSTVIPEREKGGTPSESSYDDFWQVAKHEKLGEGDFEVEISISFGGSHWCRPMSMDTHRSTDHDEDRSTDYSKHRSTSSAKSTAECNAVRIMTHEEFAEKHPHPPSPFYVKIDRPHDPAVDRQRETDIDRPPSPPIDRGHLSPTECGYHLLIMTESTHSDHHLNL
ncbi:hypothetical protein F2Q68_00044360 [Brassica cretica]|uniref:Uncharacterized protein n=1 Tax=Brassica cretica TaxID=69181 RepID=A0A8S9LPV5_BRACR|nr:hypothetical protein F2Q68_00044360 [Brassica cretica]